MVIPEYTQAAVRSGKLRYRKISNYKRLECGNSQMGGVLPLRAVIVGRTWGMVKWNNGDPVAVRSAIRSVVVFQYCGVSPDRLRIVQISLAM